MTLMTRKRRTAVRRMNDLARRRGDGGVVFLPGVSQSGMHWLARDCGLGVSLTPTAGTLGPDSVTRPSAAWLAAYVESTASTPAAVDGPVGFLSDGEGTVGAEMLGNTGGPFGSTAWWNTAGTGGNAAMTIVGSELQLTSSSASSSNRVEHPVSGLTVGKTYRVTATARLGTAASGLIHVVGDASVGYAQPSIDMNIVGATSGFYTFTFVANSPSCYLQFVTQGVGTLLVGSASLRQLTGRHATQGTGANKPVMRRGVVNLLTYSGDLTNAAWTKGALTVSTGAADPSGGMSAQKAIPSAASAEHYFVNSYAMGTGPYTVALLMSAQGLRYLAARGTLDGATYRNLGFDLQAGTVTAGGTFGVGSIAPAGNGYFLCAVSLTRTAGTTTLFVEPGNAPFSSDASQIWTSDGVAGFGFAGGAIFNGTLTAAQILAAGGIPLTTTIAASSSGGNYALEFNGSTSGLVLPSVHLQMSDDFYIGWLARCDQATGYPTLFSELDSTTNNKINLFYANGVPSVEVVSASGGSFTAIGLTSRVGQYVVISGRKLGGVLTLNVNGALERSGSLAGLTPVTLTSSAVGMWANGAANWFKGMHGGGLVIRGAVSDAERMVFDRGLAALCPIPGAPRF